MPFERYRPEKVQEKFDAVIIGSGIGGLATAAFLSKAGKKVLVLERHYVAGGFTHTFKRKDYEWDVGVHYIGEVHRKNAVLRRIFDYISDEQLQWASMGEVYDKICFPDKTYEFVAGTENFKNRLKEYFPQEATAIDRYVELVHESTKASQGFFMLRALPALVSKVASPFLSPKFMKLANQTVWDVLSSLTSNEKLIGVLTGQYGDYGLSPKQASFAMHAMVAKHYFDGGCYPIGGSASFINTIAPVIQKSGGKILVRADVDEIITHNNKAIGVRLTEGDEIFAPLVISDAGILNTYGPLLNADIKSKHNLTRKIKETPASVAHACLYMGLKHSVKELGLEKPNLWIYPDYNHDAVLEKYLQDPENSPLPVTYVSFPAAKDPTWEEHHPGTTTMEAITLTPYEWFAKWHETKWKQRGQDYEAYKDHLTQRILKNVYEYVPQIKGKVDLCELSTPLSTQHFANYAKGEIYGIEHTPKRFHQKWLRPKTPIKNLYLTGQDIATAGVGGALFGGILAAAAILKKNPLGDIMKRRSA